MLSLKNNELSVHSIEQAWSRVVIDNSKNLSGIVFYHLLTDLLYSHLFWR